MLLVTLYICYSSLARSIQRGFTNYCVTHYTIDNTTSQQTEYFYIGYTNSLYTGVSIHNGCWSWLLVWPMVLVGLLQEQWALMYSTFGQWSQSVWCRSSGLLRTVHLANGHMTSYQSRSWNNSTQANGLSRSGVEAVGSYVQYFRPMVSVRLVQEQWALMYSTFGQWSQFVWCRSSGLLCTVHLANSLSLSGVGAVDSYVQYIWPMVT